MIVASSAVLFDHPARCVVNPQRGNAVSAFVHEPLLRDGIPEIGYHPAVLLSSRTGSF